MPRMCPDRPCELVPSGTVYRGYLAMALAIHTPRFVPSVQSRAPVYPTNDATTRMKFSVFQVSRKGDRRTNQDRLGYCYTNEAVLLALADGMGGHPMGEVAAQIALQTAAAEFQINAKPVLRQPELFLQQTVMAAHTNIMSFARTRQLPDSPRTTLVLAVVQNGMAYWVHCGDSRLYLLRNREIVTRTRDHSHMEYLSAAYGGNIPPDQVPNRSSLYTCLGSNVDPIIAFSEPVQLQMRDMLLLCSDGLWAQLDEAAFCRDAFSAALEKSLPLLADRAMAEATGHSDNVSVLALSWEGQLLAARPSSAAPPERDRRYVSTILVSRAEQLAQHFNPNEVDVDDESIDRSISEIKAAIRKSQNRRLHK